MSNRPIGIFDSGVGGLTVLAKVKESLPKESVIYVGDTANAPYGGKSQDELLKYGQNIIRFLRSQDVKAIVLACGTTSSTVYEQLVAECPGIPLIDVIRPGAKACVKQVSQNPGLRLGLIATAATIKSGLFERLLKASCPDVSLLTQACPLFAPMVEAGITKNSVAKWAAETYIGSWRGSVDALILGCTHYPLLADALTGVLGENIQHINLASHAAKALRTRLLATDSLCGGSILPVYEYYVSGEADAFNKTARHLLNSNPIALKMQ